MNKIIKKILQEREQYAKELTEFLATLPERSENIEENVENRILPVMRKMTELEKKYPHFTRFMEYLFYMLGSSVDLEQEVSGE